jgi:DNA-binding NarL/FixJ family response regulator
LLELLVTEYIGEIDMNRVLVVDGNVFFRRSFREILKVYFPEVIMDEAADEHEAMRSIHSRRPDVVFMDIRPNGKSGLELCKEIKSTYPEIVACVFTDYDLPEYRKIAYQYGVDQFLLKDSLSGAEIAGLITFTLSEKVSGF